MANGTQQKVLIIDDDKFLLGMYSMKFKKEGFDVVSATSGAEGLEKLRGGLKPDIVVLDLIMPVMNGFEFLEKMRAEKLDSFAVVIVLTNQSQEADIAHAKELGVEGYIVKASSIPSEVVSRVAEIFAEKKPAAKKN